jgi:hypothetical protein
MDAIVTAPAGLRACFRMGAAVQSLPVVAVKVDDAAQSDGRLYVVEGNTVRVLESTALWGGAGRVFLGVLTEAELERLTGPPNPRDAPTFDSGTSTAVDAPLATG